MSTYTNSQNNQYGRDLCHCLLMDTHLINFWWIKNVADLDHLFCWLNDCLARSSLHACNTYLFPLIHNVSLRFMRSISVYIRTWLGQIANSNNMIRRQSMGGGIYVQSVRLQITSGGYRTKHGQVGSQITTGVNRRNTVNTVYIYIADQTCHQSNPHRRTPSIRIQSLDRIRGMYTVLWRSITHSLGHSLNVSDVYVNVWCCNEYVKESVPSSATSTTQFIPDIIQRLHTRFVNHEKNQRSTIKEIHGWWIDGRTLHEYCSWFEPGRDRFFNIFITAPEVDIDIINIERVS